MSSEACENLLAHSSDEFADNVQNIHCSWSVGRFIMTAFLVSRPGLWHFTVFMYVIPASADPEVLFTQRAIEGLVFVLFPVNLLVYAMNDLKDVDIDSQNPRKGGIFGAQASCSELRMCIVLGIILTMLVPLALIPDVEWCVIWSLVCILVNCLYNFGPTLSRVPVLDMACPLGYLLIIPFAAKVFEFSSRVGAWLWLYMVLAIFRTQLWFQRFDFDSDAFVGKRTTAVVLGNSASAILLISFLIGEIAAAGAWGCQAGQAYSGYCLCALVLELTAAGKTTTLALMAAGGLFLVPMFPCLAASWQPQTSS